MAREGFAGPEVAAHIKRALSMYRLYGFEHALSKSAVAACAEKLREPLTLAFDATGLKCAGKRVLEEEKKEESITRALFADGVETISFHADVPVPELESLLRNWYDAITSGPNAEHTFTTQIWESGLHAIEVAVRPGLAEHGVQDGEVATHKSRVAKVLAELAQDRTIPEAARTKIVDAGALAVLREVEAFRKLDRAELERRANAERAPLVELAKADHAALASGIGQERGLGQRTIFALWRAFPAASPLERAEIGEFVRRIVGTMIVEKKTQEVSRALQRIIEGERSPKHDRDADAFLECLKSEALINALVKLIEDPESQADALALIALLPLEHTGLLVPSLATAPLDVRTKLITSFVNKAPPAELIAGYIMDHGEPIAAAMLSIAERIGAEHQDLAIRACLVHEDAAVRLKGAQAVRTDSVPVFRTLLLDLIADADHHVRQAVLQVLIRARDPIAAEMLAKEIAQKDVPPDVAKMCIRGLASVGGPRAGEALRRAFVELHDKELRRAAALALASVPDRATIALLEEEEKKLLVDRAVKDACREALRRIRSR